MKKILSALAFVGIQAAAAPGSAQTDVWTHHNDNARTGANLQETQLNVTNVNVSQFGRLFSYDVDGDIYSQPLVIRNVAVPGQGTHNVVYVATMNNSVYDFDADSNRSNTQPLWRVNCNNAAPGITPVPTSDAQIVWSNIRVPGVVGIMGTPVIDRARATM